MAAARKTGRRRPRKSKTAGGFKTTTAKAKRVARKAKASLGAAAHDARLALGRTGRKVKRSAQKLEARWDEAKVPAKRRARRVERKVVAALQSVGASITAAARKAKKKLTGARRRPARGSSRKSPARRRPA